MLTDYNYDYEYYGYCYKKSIAAAKDLYYLTFLLIYLLFFSLIILGSDRIFRYELIYASNGIICCFASLNIYRCHFIIFSDLDRNVRTSRKVTFFLLGRFIMIVSEMLLMLL